MMHVIQLNDTFPPVIDGVATVVTNYARIMTETGRAKIMVGTPRYPGVDYSGYPYEVVAYHSHDTSRLAAGYRAGNPINFKALTQLSQFQPDIIHSHCPAASCILGRMLRDETGAPLIFTYHTKFDVDIARAVKSEKIQKEAIKFMIDNISACDEVWTVSHGASENLRSLGYEGDIRVVSNGVDFAKGRVDAENVAKAVEGYDLPEDLPMFLFVGRMINYKGLPLILEAMRELTNAGIDYRMVFVGGGLNKDSLQETAKEYGMSVDVRREDGTIESTTGSSAGKIIFTGPIYDRDVLRAWNTRADLFLFPSTYDTNGIVVREAAACGLASVLIKDSCAAEGITDGRNGFIIDNNGQAMFELLKELSAKRDFMHEVGQNAMDEIYISWEESVMAAADRYEVVLELQRQGKLKERRNGKSDKLLSFTTDMMDGLYDAFHFPKALIQGTAGNLTDGIRNVSESLRYGFHDVRDEVQSGFRSVRSDLRDSYDEMREGYGGIKDDMKDSLGELRDIMLDNLEGMQENFAEAGKFLKNKGSAVLGGLSTGFRGMRDELKDLKEEFDDEWNKLNGTKN